MKKIFLIGLAFLVIATVIYYVRHPFGVKVEINNNVLYVDVAITNEEKELGLGNREYMESDHGMLFVYDHSEQYRYWMKNMRFPIDIIWIKDTTIVDITKNIPTETTSQLKTYTPVVPINKVLEVNAGTCDQLGIRIGDTIRIRF
jgi:uncharacterized membrane protein (UPF0127 family)